MGGATIASRLPPDVKVALARYTSVSIPADSPDSRRAPVKPATESLYALPEVEALLREELALLPAHAARQPGGRALVVQPDARSRGLPVDVAHLTPVRLHAAGEALFGDVICSARALPIENDSFQLVFAQHLGDAQPDGGAVEELARVLAPGGLLLWSGFNPWSPWLAWIHWQTRGGGAVPQTSNADTLRRRLIRSQLAPVALDYLGTCWPRRALDPDFAIARETRGTRWLAPLRGAYLLAARKQRAVLTPLRPRVQRTGVALGARLAGTPSQRACA
jgi:SAM-dependent methyltransferase